MAETKLPAVYGVFGFYKHDPPSFITATTDKNEAEFRTFNNRKMFELEPAVPRCETCPHWRPTNMHPESLEDCDLEHGPRNMGPNDYCSKHPKRGEHG